MAGGEACLVVIVRERLNVLEMMKSVLKMMNLAFKIMHFVLKMMNFVLKLAIGSAVAS